MYSDLLTDTQAAIDDAKLILQRKQGQNSKEARNAMRLPQIISKQSRKVGSELYRVDPINSSTLKRRQRKVNQASLRRSYASGSKVGSSSRLSNHEIIYVNEPTLPTQLK